MYKIFDMRDCRVIVDTESLDDAIEEIIYHLEDEQLGSVLHLAPSASNDDDFYKCMYAIERAMEAYTSKSYIRQLSLVETA